MLKRMILLVICAVLSVGCREAGQAQYTSVSQQEALEMMAEEDNYIILDVRTAEEYAQGHIPGAVNIANESITDTMPAGLEDLNQLIFVYCRSGSRSKDAAAKLAAIGYTNIIEIGGISTWPGKVTESMEFETAMTKTMLILDIYTPGEKDGVTLTPASFQYPVMELVLSNQSGRPFTYGSAFVLEINDNGEWVETAESRDAMWTMEAYELEDGESIVLKCDLSRLCSLYPGRYRLSKEGIAAEFRLVYSE